LRAKFQKFKAIGSKKPTMNRTDLGISEKFGYARRHPFVTRTAKTTTKRRTLAIVG